MKNKRIVEFIGKDIRNKIVMEGIIRLEDDLIRGEFEILKNKCDDSDEFHFMTKSREIRKHASGNYIVTPLFGTTLVYIPQIEKLGPKSKTAQMCLYELKPNNDFSLNSMVSLAVKARQERLDENEFNNLYNLSCTRKRTCLSLHF